MSRSLAFLAAVLPPGFSFQEVGRKWQKGAHGRPGKNKACGNDITRVYGILAGQLRRLATPLLARGNRHGSIGKEALCCQAKPVASEATTGRSEQCLPSNGLAIEAPCRPILAGLRSKFREYFRVLKVFCSHPH